MEHGSDEEEANGAVAYSLGGTPPTDRLEYGKSR